MPVPGLPTIRKNCESAVLLLDVSGISEEDLFVSIVLQPLEQVFRQYPQTSIIILIDALDEALVYNGGVNIISLISKLTNLRAGIRFIITSRIDDRVERHFTDVENVPISSSEFRENNRIDICKYIEKRVLKYEAESRQKQTEDQKLFEKINIEEISNVIDGNFLYAKFWLDTVIRNRTVVLSSTIPIGLEALYSESLDRVVGEDNTRWTNNFAPILGILSVAQEPLSEQQLKFFTGQSSSNLWTNLGTLQQFVEVFVSVLNSGKQESYKIYHKSFIDFFSDKSLRIGNDIIRNRYYLSLEEWHQRITDYYRGDSHTWEEVSWKSIDNYGLKYLISHIYFLRERREYTEELYSLARNKMLREEIQNRFPNEIDLSRNGLNMALLCYAN